MCYGVPDGVSLLFTMKYDADAGKYRDEDVQQFNYKILFLF